MNDWDYQKNEFIKLGGVVENLTAIKITQMDMARGIGDLVAKAELDFEQMADAEAEALDAEVVDAEAASVMDSNDGAVIDLLMEIKDAVKETAEYTKVSADADKEASENVLTIYCTLDTSQPDIS